jgi:ArsR family transcriptional regulator
VILDLARHEQSWMREKLADQWLGFADGEISGWLRAAGIQALAVERLAGEAKNLPLLLAVGVKG